MTPMIPESYRERMRQKLTVEFEPILLEINDNSADHAGHPGYDPKGETHFSILIVSDAFIGHTQVARHRMVYWTLADELKERVHALSLKAMTSQEAA
jgi:BolA protein